jgi:hypothetical protein
MSPRVRSRAGLVTPLRGNRRHWKKLRPATLDYHGTLGQNNIRTEIVAGTGLNLVPARARSIATPDPGETETRLSLAI